MLVGFALGAIFALLAILLALGVIVSSVFRQLRDHTPPGDLPLSRDPIGQAAFPDAGVFEAPGYARAAGQDGPISAAGGGGATTPLPPPPERASGPLMRPSCRFCAGSRRFLRRIMRVGSV